LDEGDVVTFRAEELNGGGLTTHRIVGETEEGYITRGDANPSTDQAGKESPVKDAQIVAEALQVNGKVVVIPHLGTVITGVKSAAAGVQTQFTTVLGLRGATTLPVLLLMGSILLYGLDAWKERSSSDPQRNQARDNGSDIRVYLLVFVGAIVIAATAAMIAPSGPTEYGFVSSNHDTPGAGVIGAGETEQAKYRMDNPGALPVVSFLETEGNGITVQPTTLHASPGSVHNATVTLSAPPETGYYRRFVIEHRYLAVLPTAVIHSLYQVHPWLPIVIIDAIIAVPSYLLGATLIGTSRIRKRDRSRDLPADNGVRRALVRLWR
jgi:signal peptidase